MDYLAFILATTLLHDKTCLFNQNPFYNGKINVFLNLCMCTGVKTKYND